MRRQEEERQEKIAVERQNRADWLGEIKRSITLAFCGGWFGCVVGSFVPAIWTSNPQASDTWLVIGAFIGSVCGWTRGPASYTKQKNRDLNTNKLLADFSKEHRQPSIMPAPKSASDSPQSKIDAVKPITTPLIFLHPQPNYNNNGDNVVATETQQEASSTFIASAKNIPRSGAAPSVPLIPTISEEDKAPVSAYVDTPIESDLGKGEKYASMRCPNCSGNLLLPSDGFGQVICPLCRRLFWADTRRGQSISWRSLSAGHSYEDQGETKHSLPAYPPIGPTQTANSGRLTGSDRPAGADQPHHATASRQPPAKFCSSIDGAERVVWTINDRSLGNRTIPSCEDQDEAKHSLGNLSATCPRCIQTKRVSGNLNQTRCANCGHRFNYL